MPTIPLFVMISVGDYPAKDYVLCHDIDALSAATVAVPMVMCSVNRESLILCKP